MTDNRVWKCKDYDDNLKKATKIAYAKEDIVWYRNVNSVKKKS